MLPEIGGKLSALIFDQGLGGVFRDRLDSILDGCASGISLPGTDDLPIFGFEYEIVFSGFVGE